MFFHYLQGLFSGFTHPGGLSAINSNLHPLFLLQWHWDPPTRQVLPSLPWKCTCYCWWFRNPAITTWGWQFIPSFTKVYASQVENLPLFTGFYTSQVENLPLFTGFYTSQVVVWDIWTINSINGFRRETSLEKPSLEPEITSLRSSLEPCSLYVHLPPLWWLLNT